LKFITFSTLTLGQIPVKKLKEHTALFIPDAINFSYHRKKKITSP